MRTMHLWMEESQKLTYKSRESHKQQAVETQLFPKSIFYHHNIEKNKRRKIVIYLHHLYKWISVGYIFKARNIPLRVWNIFVHLIHLKVNFETNVTGVGLFGDTWKWRQAWDLSPSGCFSPLVIQNCPCGCHVFSSVHMLEFFALGLLVLHTKMTHPSWLF